MLVIVRDAHDAHHRTLPDVLMIELRHSHIEMMPQLIFKAAQYLAFILQRSRVGNVEFQGEKADWHVALRAIRLSDSYNAFGSSEPRVPLAPNDALLKSRCDGRSVLSGHHFSHAASAAKSARQCRPRKKNRHCHPEPPSGVRDLHLHWCLHWHCRLPFPSQVDFRTA